jgi:hypothetical protein
MTSLWDIALEAVGVSESSASTRILGAISQKAISFIFTDVGT